jgi:cyclopropane fatty-acyl-phospholipid synthase-like methyltransferase
VGKPYASASARNAAPILGVLRHELRDRSSVFEIGSGTGQHAVTFAAALPGITWQTSDLPQSHDGIRAWIEEAGLPNVLQPLEFDVLSASVPAASYDAVFSANTAHIMSYAAVRRMFALAGAMLRPGGVFCIYGPFSRGGRFSTASNEAFDASLRARNAAMGIRDLDDLEVLAGESGMVLTRSYGMPSNNLLVIWTRQQNTAKVSPISD